MTVVIGGEFEDPDEAPEVVTEPEVFPEETLETGDTVPPMPADLDYQQLMLETPSITELEVEESTNLVANPDFESSATTTVTTNLLTNPSMEAASGTITVATNVITNPGYEGASVVDTSAFIPRWYGAGGGAGTNTLTISAAKSGALGYRKTWTTAPTGNADTGFHHRTAVTPGEVLSFAAQLRSSKAMVMYAWVEWRDAALASLSSSSRGTGFQATSGTWVRVHKSALTVPAGAAHADLIVGPYNTPGDANWAAGDTLDIDEGIAVKAGLVPDYFDGITAAAGDYTYAWTGTAHASASQKRALGVTSWSNPGGGSHAAVYQTSEDKYSGDRAVRIVVKALGGAGGVHAYGIEQGLRPASESPKVASAWIKAPAGTQIGIRCTRVVGGSVKWGDVNGDKAVYVSATGAWERVAVVMPTYAGADQIQVRAGFSGYAGSFNIGDVCYVDALQIEEGETASSYFDGSTSPDGTFTYAWTGTANASTSTKNAITSETWAAVNGIIYYDTSWSVGGTASGRLESTSTSVNELHTHAEGSLFAVSGDTMYVGGVDVKSDGTMTDASLRVDWYDAGSALLSSTPATSIALDVTSNRPIVTATSPATATQARLVVGNGPSGVTTGDTVWIDNATFVTDTEVGFTEVTDEPLTQPGVMRVWSESVSREELQLFVLDEALRVENEHSPVYAEDVDEELAP